CSGIENYSTHFDGRQTGEAPFCLFDFFPKDFLLIVDESHIALPQLRGMYAGDHARKKALVEFGFRLPTAFDNRPLKFEEIERYFKDALFVSATPGEYELTNSNQIVEQIIRPTGLLDPVISIHSRVEQLDHLVAQIKETTKKGYRSLVMVMTKKLAEELAEYLEERQIKVCYLHSDLKTPQRTELLQKLRLGIFDCLVGVNLLREGIDLPEVALVAIMDADLESFLRDKRSLIQIIGRAARNTDSHVILYADKITGSMQAAIDETNRRRTLQKKYNKQHNISPTSVKRDVTKSITNLQALIAQASKSKKSKKQAKKETKGTVQEQLTLLEQQMQEAANSLDFEKAIFLREQWYELKQQVEK
ncbi:MAG: helicase-related protein, partial [Candidatus Babeliales bacterium]